MYTREPIFFLNFLQLHLDWQKNSKTKVEKAFFFIFISSGAEMGFWGPKKRKVTENGYQKPVIFR
jgi:hypothetical protein